MLLLSWSGVTVTHHLPGGHSFALCQQKQLFPLQTLLFCSCLQFARCFVSSHAVKLQYHYRSISGTKDQLPRTVAKTIQLFANLEVLHSCWNQSAFSNLKFSMGLWYTCSPNYSQKHSCPGQYSLSPSLPLFLVHRSHTWLIICLFQQFWVLDFSYYLGISISFMEEATHESQVSTLSGICMTELQQL